MYHKNDEHQWTVRKSREPVGLLAVGLLYIIYFLKFINDDSCIVKKKRKVKHKENKA